MNSPIGKMNIWIVNHYAVAPNESGGTRHYTLARELTQRGHHVTIIAGSFNHFSRLARADKLRHVGQPRDEDGVTFLWIRTSAYRGNGPARVFGFLQFAWRVWGLRRAPPLPPPDLVLGSSPHPLAALAAERLAARFGAPFVLEVRDLWPQTLMDVGRLAPHHPMVWLFARLERYLYRRADHVVTLLPGSAEYLCERGLRGADITWIPNGIDRARLREPASPGEPQGAFTLMYVGSHGIANGLENLIAAAAILFAQGYADRLRIRLIGEGPEKSRLAERVRTLGLSNVSFEPPVAKQAVFALLQEADALVLCLRDSPVYRWGVSLNKLYDYLYSARPIVFAARTPLDPVAQAGAGVTVEPDEPAALAAAITRIIETPLGERRAMGRRGLEYVCAHHDLRTLARRLGMVLERVEQQRRTSQDTATRASMAARVKRAMDIVGTVIALLLCALPMALIAVLIRMVMGRPILFRQQRPGLNGALFEIIKFRTMQPGALGSDAERLTALGRCLRSLSLDELPELWNVLKGEMSLVGPRPLLMQYLPLYTPEQARRHNVKPGLTGWAQVNGRNALEWEERFRLDLWYVDNWSLSLDMKILARTVIKVLRREGIAPPGQATIDFFTGSGSRAEDLGA
ncbi:MAG: sugar transferase [Gammaproteobacteria bacterium]